MRTVARGLFGQLQSSFSRCIAPAVAVKRYADLSCYQQRFISIEDIECRKFDDKIIRPSLFGPLHWVNIKKDELPYEVWAVIRRVFSYTDEQYFTRIREEFKLLSKKPKVDDKHFIVFSDASPAGWGVVELSPKRISCFSAPFRVGRDGGVPPFSIKPSIEYNELVGAVHGVVHTIATSEASQVTLCIDNKEIVKRIAYWQRKMKFEAADSKPPTETELLEEQEDLLKEPHTAVLVENVMDNIIQQLLHKLSKSKVELNVCWVPGFMNLADAPSRGYIKNFQHVLEKSAEKETKETKKRGGKAVKKGKKAKEPSKSTPEQEEKAVKQPPLDLDFLPEVEVDNDLFNDFYKKSF